MPLSRLTQTLPLACAAAISEPELPDVVVLLETDDAAGARAAPGEFASGEAAGAGGAFAGSVADSVAVRFLWRRFLCFLVVSDFVSLDVPCALAQAGKTTIV